MGRLTFVNQSYLRPLRGIVRDDTSFFIFSSLDPDEGRVMIGRHTVTLSVYWRGLRLHNEIFYFIHRINK